MRRKCPAEQEASAFNVNLKHSFDALEQAKTIQDLVPIHVILGTKFDFMYVRNLILTPSSRVVRAMHQAMDLSLALLIIIHSSL